MTTAEHDRAAILDRVAAGIWKASKVASPVCWEQAKIEARADTTPHLTEAVRLTQAEARAAVGALIIGADPRAEDVRLCMAGEHATGIVGGLCAEAFDAMLAEVLA